MALWTPAEITTALWLDAADSDTITLNSGNVSQWDDKSTNNYDFVQATSASQPAYIENEVNSNNVLRFNSDFLTNSTVGIASNSAFTLFVAAKWDTIANSTFPVVVALKTTNASTGWILFASVTSGYQNYAFGSSGTWGRFRFSADSSSNAAAILGVSYGGGGADLIGEYSTRRDGSEETVYSASNFAGQGNTNSIIGQGHSGNPLSGDVYEVILVNEDMALADKQKIEGYLAWKWGLEGNLDAEHPYKNAAPTTDPELFFGYFGTTRDKNGALAQRRVIASPDSTGECVANILSDPVTGEYEIAAAPDTPHTLIFTGEPDRNAQVFTGVLAAEKPE